MKKNELESLDLPTLQSKHSRIQTGLKVMYGFAIVYLAFVGYALFTREFDINRFGPLVAGFGGLAVVLTNLRQQTKLLEEEMARRG